MIRTVSLCSECATTRVRPRLDMPMVRNRGSTRPEWPVSGNVVESVSSSTVAASWKSIPCFLRFVAAFLGSHLKTTLTVYAVARSARIGG